MRNKKAWMRIIEAFIAILIIAGVLLVIASRAPETDKENTIHTTQRHILKQISADENLRVEILKGYDAADKIKIKNKIEEFLPSSYSFQINICELDAICGIREYPETETDIYADEILISSTLETYVEPSAERGGETGGSDDIIGEGLVAFAPKKLKLFIWKKQES